MLEVNGMQFLQAVTELVRVKNYIRQATAAATESIHPETKAYLLGLLNNMMPQIFLTGSKSAWSSANRLKMRLEADDVSLTFGAAGECLADIESRFADHLGFIRLFVVTDDKSYLMGGAENLLSPLTAQRFTSARFDYEEAAKCLCLSRATACVFHSMRVTEIGIRALSKRLSFDDPVKASEKNWSTILKSVKDKIDELYPVKGRHAGSLGTTLEAIYANLEAIRNPWRNATMHVESVYTLDEASHILNCTKVLLDKMALIFDENGAEVAPDTGAFSNLFTQ